MTCLFDGPGYYQLVGGPASGKTTTALLLATSKMWSGRSLYASTHAEYSAVIYEVQRPDLLMTSVETVKEFFSLVQCMEPNTLLCLDSLATLQPDHPSLTEIASSVNRHWVVPKGPVLVVNQQRVPRAPGGALWHSLLAAEFRLEVRRTQPFLLSHLSSTDLWLTWGDGYPALRALTQEELKTWVKGVTYGPC